MGNISIETVQEFYDQNMDRKIKDFVYGNRRIDLACQSLLEWLPKSPKRILEIGCGIGAISWRLARLYPEAQVIGADLSPGSIQFATTCFRRPNLTFFQGHLVPESISGPFDYVILMDVYEHISRKDRPAMHQLISHLTNGHSRIFLSCPTPEHLTFLRSNHPEQIQPVDEDVTISCLQTMSAATGTIIMAYKRVDVWREGDYFHAVLGPLPTLRSVPFKPAETTSLLLFGWHRIKEWVGTRRRKHILRHFSHLL